VGPFPAGPSALDEGTDGAGPYVVVPSQSVAGSQYTLVPNAYYYDPSAIRFSKVVVKIISQPSTMLEAIKSGELDVAQGDNTTVSTAQAAGLTVVAEPGGFDQILILDRGTEAPDGSGPNPLASVQVRQALNYAINRRALTEAIVGKYGTPTDEIGSRDGFDPSVQDYYSYGPARAKSLLAAAGYAKGFTLELPSQTTFGTLADQTMDVVAQDFAAVGVQLKVVSTVSLTQWVNDVLGGKYPVAGFEATAFPPLSEWYGFWFAPNGIENQHGWVDPTMNALYREATVSSSPSMLLEGYKPQDRPRGGHHPVVQLRCVLVHHQECQGRSVQRN
jgi:peptide/nickel transport system substrate-binding protein